MAPWPSLRPVEDAGGGAGAPAQAAARSGQKGRGTAARRSEGRATPDPARRPLVRRRRGRAGCRPSASASGGGSQPGAPGAGRQPRKPRRPPDAAGAVRRWASQASVGLLTARNVLFPLYTVRGAPCVRGLLEPVRSGPQGRPSMVQRAGIGRSPILDIRTLLSH